LAHVAAILEHSGDFNQAKLLTELFCNSVTSEFEFEGDLTKEKLDLLYDYSTCACLSGNGKLASEIIDEYYFNRRSKASTYDGTLNNLVSDLISDTPEFEAMEIRITNDINAMRANAITFLRSENVWPNDD
jgi:hypothetical protein